MLGRPSFNCLVIFMLTFGIILSGCGGGSSGGGSNPPVISVALSPAASQSIDQGQQISFTASVTNDSSSKGVTWTQTGGSLSGQTVTAATYTAGSPGSASVTATSAADTTKSATTNVTIAAAPSITTTTLPAGTVGTPYSQKISATGGTGSLTYSISSGTLPAGLTLTSNTISGMPTTAGAGTPFTVKVTDASMASAGPGSATQQLSIAVNAAVPTLKITTTSPLPSGSVGGLYSAALLSTGGTAPISWSATSLPAGLAIDPTTGTITGTPTAVGAASVMVTATDSGSPQQTAQATLSLTVAQLMITTTSLLNPMLGEAYNQQLLATDSGGTGPITWSLANGTSVPAGLTLNSNGTITGTPTGSPGATSFTVQATDASVPPQQATQPLTLTVTSTSNCTTESGSESMLSGQYAMSLTGFDANGPAGMLASFTADGTGKITAGVADFNSTTGVQTDLSIVTASSSYSVGSDKRGCLTLTTSQGTRVFHIALGLLTSSVATQGRAIEFDSTGTNIAGTFQAQQSAAFSNTKVEGSYALVANAPLPASGGFFAAVGQLVLNAGAVTGVCDMNYNGVIDPGNSSYPGSPITLTSGSYNIVGNGRGTLSFTIPLGTPTPSATTFHLVAYVLNATQMYLMSTDTQSASNSLFSGFIGQQTGLPYATSSLGTTSILFASGQTQAGGTASQVEAGVFTPDGAGDFTLTGDQNSGGTVNALSQLAGTYSVDANTGRVLITGTGSPSPNVVMYMVLSNWAYILSTDSSVMVGNLEPQSGGPFTNGTLTGIYTFGTIVPVVSGSPLRVGQTTYDGAGNVSSTFDVNEGGFLSIDNVVTGTYAVSSTGRVVSPAAGTTLDVSYLTNSGTVISFGVTATDTDPTIQIMDQ